jgi:hypothetical protein
VKVLFAIGFLVACVWYAYLMGNANGYRAGIKIGRSTSVPLVTAGSTTPVICTYPTGGGQ